MLIVYGDNRSGNCLKVKWMLNAAGRGYRWADSTWPPIRRSGAGSPGWRRRPASA